MKEQNMMHLMTNIRNAHRYVVAYQRRLLDGIQLLNQRVDKTFIFYWWTPLFNAPPPQRGTDINGTKWAWDFIPLSFVRFQWKKGDATKGNGATYILIEHIIDTELAKLFAVGGEPDPIESNLQQTNESSSLLAARVVRFDNPVSSDDWSKEWGEAIFELYNKDSDDVKSREELWPRFNEPIDPQQFERNGITLKYFAVSIANLPDRKCFETKFITPLLKTLKDMNK